MCIYIYTYIYIYIYYNCIMTYLLRGKHARLRPSPFTRFARQPAIGILRSDNIPKRRQPPLATRGQLRPAMLKLSVLHMHRTHTHAFVGIAVLFCGRRGVTELLRHCCLSQAARHTLSKCCVLATTLRNDAMMHGVLYRGYVARRVVVCRIVSRCCSDTS